MDITITSAFPLAKERGGAATVSYKFELDDPGTEIPLDDGRFVSGLLFPQELTNMLDLGVGLPVQVSHLGPAPKDRRNPRQPRQITDQSAIGSFNPAQLYEMLEPGGEEAVIGLALQVAINRQNIGADAGINELPLTKHFLVHRDPKLLDSDRIRVAEIADPEVIFTRDSIYNLIGRRSGIIFPKTVTGKKGGKVIGVDYCPSEYFGWPTNQWGRNCLVDNRTYQIRHLSQDLFLGGELVIEPVVEAARGPAEVHERGMLVGYDLVAIGWQKIDWKDQVKSRVLREFR